VANVEAHPMNRRDLSLLVLCVALPLGCSKKDDAATGEAKAGDAKAGDAKAGDVKTTTPVDPKANAAGEAPVAEQTATECPKSLAGTDKVDRVITKACGVVPVTADYAIDGATLTLEAGATLAFAAGARLSVGYYEPAKLIVKGTTESPVKLTATGEEQDKVRGMWQGVFLHDKASRSSIDGLVIESAGSEDEAALVIEASDVDVARTTVRKAKGMGIEVKGEGMAEITGATLAEVGKIAMRVTAKAAGGVGGDNTFPQGALVQVQPGAIDKSAQWAALGIPWLVSGQVQVNGTPGERARLTIAPGAELRFAAEGSLDVGYYAEAGLVAEGSEAQPIVFRGHEREEAGAWGGLRIFGKAEARLQNVRISDGGRQEAEGALLIEGAARVSLHEVGFVGDLVGVVIQGTEAKLEVFDALAFEGTPVAMRAPARYLAALGSDNRYTSEPSIVAEADKLEADATWKAQPGAKLELTGMLQVSGTRLVIEAGSTIWVEDGIEVQVGYYENAGLELRGTPDAPVTFQGLRDESGTWGGIVLFAKAKGNVFENVVLRNAGGQAGVRFDGESDGKVENLRCDKCSASGLTWTCTSRVEYQGVVAGEGTPKDYEDPPCN